MCALYNYCSVTLKVTACDVKRVHVHVVKHHMCILVYIIIVPSLMFKPLVLIIIPVIVQFLFVFMIHNYISIVYSRQLDYN